jgi:predicted Zn-ribbon and HTH transcriptional regulator
MGDGTIEKDKLRFAFWNNEEELINEVCECVKNSIGETKGTINKLRDGRIQVKFCPFVGVVLHLAGAPLGNKTIQEFEVPEWIMNGKKEIKAAFLKGLFDDESSPDIPKNKKDRTRRLIFAQCKWDLKERSLKEFLSSIKQMLKEFGVMTTKIREQESFIDKKGRRKIVLSFSISGKKNLENFLSKIGLTHPKKKAKLKKAIESFVDIHKSKRTILEIIKNSSRPLSTTEISKIAKLNKKNTFFHLNELFKAGKIVKSSGRNPTLWFKKRTSSMISTKEKVISVIKDFGPITVKNIAKMSGVKEKRVFQIIKDLAVNNEITKVGKIRDSKSERKSNLWSSL